MESDRPSQEGREDVPSESSFLVSAPVADPTPVVTRSWGRAEGGRAEKWVSRRKLWENRK